MIFVLFAFCFIDVSCGKVYPALLISCQTSLFLNQTNVYNRPTEPIGLEGLLPACLGDCSTAYNSV